MWSVAREPTDLISQPLASNDSDLIADPFIGFEVEGELGVVAFDDDFGRLLNGLYGKRLVSAGC